MPSLVEIQRGVAAATISGDAGALAGLGIVAGTMSAEARVDVYRNNVFGNYRKTLAATFPYALARLVGGIQPGRTNHPDGLRISGRQRRRRPLVGHRHPPHALFAR